MEFLGKDLDHSVAPTSVVSWKKITIASRVTTLPSKAKHSCRCQVDKVATGLSRDLRQSSEQRQVTSFVTPGVVFQPFPAVSMVRKMYDALCSYTA